MVQFQNLVNQMRGDISEIKRTMVQKEAESRAANAEGAAGGVPGEKPVEEPATAALPPESPTLDVFGADFGSSGTVSQGAVEPDADEEKKDADDESKKASSEEEEQEDYMELFVAKELKDKIEPILEQLTERKDEFQRLDGQVAELDTNIKRVDLHYNDVAKAMLTKQGIMLDEVTPQNILREYKRISEKESKAKFRIKRDQSSVSPSGRAADLSPRKNAADPVTEYVKKLAPVAV